MRAAAQRNASAAPLGTSTRPPEDASNTDGIPKARTTKEKVLWSGFWFLLLLVSCFISWFVCGIWIILMPLETLWEPLMYFNQVLQNLIMWPRILGVAIKESHMQFTNPMDGL